MRYELHAHVVGITQTEEVIDQATTALSELKRRVGQTFLSA